MIILNISELFSGQEEELDLGSRDGAVRDLSCLKKKCVLSRYLDETFKLLNTSNFKKSLHFA